MRFGRQGKKRKADYLRSASTDDLEAELDRRQAPPWQGCMVAPPGWWCSIPAGHDGPCAARPGAHP